MSPAPLPSPPLDDEGRLAFREAAREWDEWLTMWEQEVWPVFRRRGLTMGDALTQWHLNDLAVLLQNLGDPDEPWQDTD